MSEDLTSEDTLHLKCHYNFLMAPLGIY